MHIDINYVYNGGAGGGRVFSSRLVVHCGLLTGREISIRRFVGAACCPHFKCHEIERVTRRIKFYMRLAARPTEAGSRPAPPISRLAHCVLCCRIRRSTGLSSPSPPLQHASASRVASGAG